MTERFHVATFVWGVILTLSGTALAAVGFGWWDLSSIDLRFLAPALVILVGIVIVAGALLARQPIRSEVNKDL